jgi:copper chaperone NosL
LANFLHAEVTIAGIYQHNSKGDLIMGKRIVLLGFCILFSFASAAVLLAQDDVQKHSACQYCGMDRAKFAHSRMMAVYEDGSSAGTCSIHCEAIEFALHIDKTPKTIQVGDYYSKMLVDAEKAFWVLGGNKPGVMTQRAKWAFGKKEDAEKFMKDNGGAMISLEQAFKAAFEDMYADTRIIQERRKMRQMKH